MPVSAWFVFIHCILSERAMHHACPPIKKIVQADYTIWESGFRQVFCGRSAALYVTVSLKVQPAQEAENECEKEKKMNKKAMYKLSYGLFVLTAKEGEKDNGCIINTAIHISNFLLHY